MPQSSSRIHEGSAEGRPVNYRDVTGAAIPEFVRSLKVALTLAILQYGYSIVLLCLL